MAKSEKPVESARPVIVTVGLVLAIIGLLLSAIPIVNNFAFVIAVLALLLGIIAIVKARKNKEANRKTATIVIVLSLIACGVVLASQSWYGSSIDKASKDVNNSLDKASGKKTNDILGKDVAVQIGKFEASQDQYGVDSTQLPVTVINKLSEKKTFSVQIEAVDATGKRLADDTVYANDLGANQSQDFKTFQYVESEKIDSLKTATFKVLSVSEY